METEDIFSLIGAFALPIAVFALMLIFLLPEYQFNDSQFLVNDTNISINSSWIISELNNTGQTTTFNSTQFETGEPATIKTSWLTSFIESISKWANYYTITEIDNRYSNNTGDQDLSGYFKLDQTTPQTIENGTPIFSKGLKVSADNEKIYFGSGNDVTAYFDGTWQRLKPENVPLLIGSTPQSLTLNSGTDGVGIVQNSTTTGNSRGLIVWSEYSGSNTIKSGTQAGLNSFAHIHSNDKLTSTINGGTAAGRYVVRQYGSGTISQANAISTMVIWGAGGTGTITTANGVQAEKSTATTNQTFTTFNDFNARGVGITGGTVTTRTGLNIETATKTSGTFTNQYGIKIDDLSGATNNYAIYTKLGDVSFGDDLILRNDNDKIWFGTGKDASIYYDGTNMIFNTSAVGTGLAHFSNNVSATGYITRTSIYDKSKGNALDWVKDTTELTDTKGINHNAFYGSTEYEVTDYSRPETEEVCLDIINTDKEDKEIITKECSTKITYPYKKIEEGVILDEEIAMLTQAIYELKQQNEFLQEQINNLTGKDTKIEEANTRQDKAICQIKIFDWCLIK